MDIGTATVLAASVTAVGALLGNALHRFRRENRNDHAEVIHELRWLRRIVERVEQKHDNHVDAYHLGGTRGESEVRSAGSAREDAPN